MMGSMTPEEILTRCVSEVIDKNSLEKKLNSGKKLVVKLGIDPTSPDLHLGHSVVLRKLSAFQQLGHHVVLVIGDFTALVGDPSGRNTQRPPLTEAEIEKNLADFKAQAGKILDLNKLTIRKNSEWLKDLGLTGLFKLASSATVNQLLERKDFQDRLKENNSLTVLEILYPLLQAYDSVALKADIELGGTDQKFNLLMGRQIQKRYGQSEQDILTTPLLVGLDGKDKMSKSLGNYIGLTEDAPSMFGKVMSLPDFLLESYFDLTTNVSSSDANQILEVGPYEAKKRLASEIVTLYHDSEEAKQARGEFDRVFSSKENPSNIVEIKVDSQPQSYVSLTSIAFNISRSEAKRLIEQKALEIDGVTILDPEEEVTPKNDQVLKLGKHRFVRIAI